MDTLAHRRSRCRGTRRQHPATVSHRALASGGPRPIRDDAPRRHACRSERRRGRHIPRRTADRLQCEREGSPGWLRRFSGGGTWANGTILFALRNGSVVRVPDTGGRAAPVDSLPWKAGQTVFAEPWFLPDGRHFLISKRGDPALYVASLDTVGLQRIEESASRVIYAAGHCCLFVVRTCSRGRSMPNGWCSPARSAC